MYAGHGRGPGGLGPVAGTTLAVSPNSPQTAGTPLTTATVYPAPVAGGSSQDVQFFDGQPPSAWAS